MNSRVDKYYDNKEVVGSRTKRNDQLYKEINKAEIENFDIRSNATVIGNNRNNIDVEKIKSILDMHYNDVPKRRSIQIEKTKEEVKPLLETKEYDINVILNKAKEDKIENYNEQRVKKLHDTQFDILKKLDIRREDFIEDYDGDSEVDIKKSDTAAQKLQDLINTITMNEADIKKAKELENREETNEDALDIYSDLKGSENTVTLEGLQEKTEQMIQTMAKTTAMDSSFFTKSDHLRGKDFEDFKDIEESGSGVFIKILIALLIVVFIIGIAILVKTFLT